MVLNAAQMCELLQGELIGDGEKKIHGPSPIDDGRPGTVTFLANPKYEDFAYTTSASVLVVPKAFVPRDTLIPTMIKVDDVYGAMIFLIEKFSKNGTPKPGVSPFAYLDPSLTVPQDVSIGHYCIVEKEVTIGNRSIIYPQVFIGHGSSIGEDVVMYPGVKIYPNTQIGDRCILHANAVIGCDGFGYHLNDGEYHKIMHVGSVILEDDVEIGANAVIDRGTISVTRVGKGTKIDNLVQIAHNVTIGENTVIAAQAGIAGSSSIGDHVRIGGQVGIAGHIHIANDIEIQGQSGVNTGNYREGTKLFGSPAIKYTDYLKSYALFRKLPSMVQRIEAIEKQLAAEKKERL